ncbi:C4-dicarboxylate ABC transporter [Vallitalea longa]|uniref:C4-dicarboxylate ABC transporter n=1 Tax=Vallitalea longa TaxID=2936439 RepID=A0A9W5Y8K6_9FIRM|nr:C4-dicarboxylate TRAP transporter substrate-binding protein [Vallitalea longa]GKX27743.1 C4-dicarboxylate ABC transporter [Vallitalea longa]
MKKFKLFLVVTLVLSMLTACGSSNKGTETSNEGDTSKQSTQNASVTIQIGYANNPGEPLDLAVNQWKKLIEERSNGNMKVEIFPSSQLGAKNELIDQMLAGDSVITLADGAFYSDRGVKDFGIVFAPYLFDTWDQCWKLIESDWYKEQSQKLEDQGLKLLTSNWVYGARHTMTTKPVRTVDDLKGMKIRVPDNTIQIKGFEVLGASPTPMALGEVYTSLQQGTIDGLENPLSVLYNGKFYEVAKYLTLDGHVQNFTTWVAGLDFFNSLSQEQQKILVETGNEAGLYNNGIQEQVTEDTLKKLKDEGVEIIEVDLSEFQEKAEAFYSLPEITSQWSEGLHDKIKEAISDTSN